MREPKDSRIDRTRKKDLKLLSCFDDGDMSPNNRIRRGGERGVERGAFWMSLWQYNQELARPALPANFISKEGFKPTLKQREGGPPPGP